MSGNPRRADGSRRSALLRWLRAQSRPCWICGLPIDYAAPQGTPLCFECDEIVPVSRGGSPLSKDNVDAAHRCCNNWRRAKGKREVLAARELVAARFGGWSTPLDFVEKAKALRSCAKPPAAGHKRVSGSLGAGPATTTDWI